MDRSRSLAVARSQAVGTRVATPDDHHALPGRQDGLRFGNGIAFAAAVALRQKLHREVDAFELTAGNAQVARLLGAAAEQDGVELLPEILHRNIPPNVRIGLEADPFGAHL